MEIYSAQNYIDSDTLDFVTRKDCPAILNNYIANILILSLGINGSPEVFCKCANGGYNLSWILENGEEYIMTFSEEELLSSLEKKYVAQEIKIES